METLIIVTPETVVRWLTSQRCDRRAADLFGTDELAVLEANETVTVNRNSSRFRLIIPIPEEVPQR
jgi:hypothetical protein